MPPLSVDDYRAKVNEHRVACRICGYQDHSLTTHLQNVHQLTPGQYRTKYEGAKVFGVIVGEMLRAIDRTPKTTDALEEFASKIDFGPDTDDLLLKLSGYLSKAPKDPARTPTRNPNFYFAPVVTKTIATAIALGKNCMITGPTGSGKTDLVRQIFANVQSPMLRANMNGEVTAANFIGAMRVGPQGTYYHYGLLPTAMRDGIPLLVDEVDYTPPHIAAVMNSVLESGGSIYLPDTGETIYAKGGFMIIATGNTAGKGDSNGVYTGTEIMNTAFLDRFAVKVTVDYLPMDKEIALLTRMFPKTDLDHLTKMVKVANEIRDSFKKGNIPVTMSTRKLIDYFQLLPSLGIKEAVQATIMDWMEDDNVDLVKTFFKVVGISF